MELKLKNMSSLLTFCGTICLFEVVGVLISSAM